MFANTKIGGGGPTPQQLLVLEASLFTLSQNCMKLCARPEQIATSSKMKDAERAAFDQSFNDCIHHCTVSFVQTRQYLRDRLLQDLDKTTKDNEALYANYYAS